MSIGIQCSQAFDNNLIEGSTFLRCNPEPTYSSLLCTELRRTNCPLHMLCLTGLDLCTFCCSLFGSRNVRNSSPTDVYVLMVNLRVCVCVDTADQRTHVLQVGLGACVYALHVWLR